MKKLFTLTKTILIAAMLCVGMSAWGYSVPYGYIINKVYVGTDNGDNTVTPEDFSSGTYSSSVFGKGTCWHATEAEKLKVVDFSTSYVAAPAVGESVGETRPTYVGGTTDATKYVLQWQSRSNATQYGEIIMDQTVSSGKLVLGLDLNFGGYNTNYAPQIIFVDGEGNSVLQLGFNCNSGETEYFQYKVGDGSATNDGTVGSSKLRGKYTGHSIRDIVIDMETGEVVYTLDCIGTDGKRYSKTSTKGINIGTGKTIAGIRISRNFAQASQSDYIWIDNVELYSVVREVTYNYTIKAKAGETTLKTLASGECKNGFDYGVYVPYVIENDGSFYVLDSNSTYYKNFTMGDSDEEQIISYTLDETIVAFTDGEGGYRKVVYENNNNYSSGDVVDNSGNSNYTNARNRGFSLGTLPAGVYYMQAYVVNSTKGRAVYLRDNSSPSEPLVYVSNSSKITGLLTSGNFTLSSSTTLVVNGANDPNNTAKSMLMEQFDYVLIRKATVGASLGTNGYATFASSYPLALGSMTASTGDVTAYYATAVGGRSVTLSSIAANVEAGEGLILKGTAGATITIPVAASGSSIDNYLVGCPTETVLTTNANYYVLVNNGATAEFQCLDAHGATIPAGKAYLNVEGASSRLSIVFDDNSTTSISTKANSQEPTANSYYDLQGRRVAQPTKGLYIVNGKKVVVK